MLIAVLIFQFFHTKASTERFFSSATLVVLYHSNAEEFDNKSFGFNPSPAKPNLIQRTAYPSFRQSMREILKVSS